MHGRTHTFTVSPPVLTSLMFNGTHPNYALASMPALAAELVDVAHRPTELRFQHVLETIYNAASDVYGDEFVWEANDDVVEVVLNYGEWPVASSTSVTI